MDWFSLICVFGLLCFAPFIVFYFVMACDQYQCSISQPLFELFRGETTLLSIWGRSPSFTWSAAKIYGIWVALQVRIRRIRSIIGKRKSFWGGGLISLALAKQGGLLANVSKLQVVLSLRCSCICVFLMLRTSLFPATLVECRMEHGLLLVMNTYTHAHPSTTFV